MRFRPTLAVLSVAVIAMATAGALVLFDGDNEVEADDCGDGVTWAIDHNTLTISRSTGTGTGQMYNYGKETAPWYQHRGLFTQIIVGSGVVSIGNYAFYGLSTVSSVTLPDSVTSIGEYAFNSVAMSSFTIPTGVTSIGKGAFNACQNLTGIVIPNGVASINEGTFNYCPKLESVTIPDSVTSIGKLAFQYCSGLTSITIPDSVKSVEDDAFNGCTGLTRIHFGNQVTFGTGLFSSYTFYCDEAKKVVVDKSNCSLFQGATFTGDADNGMVWVPNDVDHYVTYDTDGGSDKPDTVAVKEGNEFSVVTYQGEKEGCAFVGWSYKGETYAAGQTIRMM